MKKKLKISYNAPVALTFILICFATMIIGYLTGGRSTQLLLGHAGWSHFIGNASYILLLGPMLEEKYGSKTLMEIICITALVTGLVNYVFFWNSGLCGASGVVFAFIVLASFTGFREGEIPLTFILVAVIFIGQQIYEGVVLSDNISNTAHIVGGLVGGVIGYLLNKKKAW